ncbi:hypothetical protein THAOC_17404 [Thalassiosira oceanica]|uniref:Uncharacterized protein n=1 Tax=Thalassiosira oceanica TaxID=159749 RepID=K0S781_THAOC|nr:hypothetical protein THAOC_17404 [Thalassiosira oceanica]|eukprot:EJK62003.1 hypothetical protein THAOC_17404 [Thalassiosira oceanica]
MRTSAVSSGGPEGEFYSILLFYLVVVSSSYRRRIAPASNSCCLPGIAACSANAAPAAVPPPAAAPAAPAAPSRSAAGPRTAGSIAAARAFVAAAPDDVPSAAAAGRQSDDSTKDEEMMEVEEPAAVMPEVNRKLSASLKNEVDKRWDETEADGEARWRKESEVDSKKATRTVRVVSTDKHLRNDLGRGVVSVHLRETNIGHIDGHFLDVDEVPVLSCFPATISFDHDPSTGQPILSVSTRRDEASFTAYDGSPSIEPWRVNEWGEMPDTVARIYEAIDRAEGLLGSIRSQYFAVNLPHVAKPDVKVLAANRHDEWLLRLRLDQATDQFYLLVATSKLLDRSVENYHDLQVDGYWEEQRKAREESGEDAQEDIPTPIFSFPALSARITNSVQEEVKEDFLDNTAVGAHDRLRDRGCVASHHCYRSQDVNFGHEKLSADNSAAHVYHEFERGKYGSAGKGRTRLRHIREDHAEWRMNPPRAYSVVNMANLTEDAQRDVVGFLLTEFKRFQCPRVPETLRETLVQDMQGLSVGSSVILHSLSEEQYDPQKIGTGGIALSGSLTATVRNTLESGAQRTAERLGVAQVGNRHECLESGALGCAAAHLVVLQDIAGDLLSDFEEEGILRPGQKYTARPIRTAWNVGRMESTPKYFVNAKIAVARAISPIEGPGFYENAFGDQVPKDSPENIEECYACKLFTEDQRRGAVTKTEVEVFLPLERDGGFVEVVDVCEEAWEEFRAENLRLLRQQGVFLPGGSESDEDLRYPSVLYALLTRDTSASLGLPANSPDAPKWEIYERGGRKYDYWRLYGFITMVLKCKDKKLRSMILVAPWCRWMFNRQGVPMGFIQMHYSFRSACSSTFSGLLLDVICTERTTVNRSLDRPVRSLPIVLYGVFTLHMSQFMHLIVRNINVLIKSCLMRVNQLHINYTNLLRKNLDLHIFSRASRNALLLEDRIRARASATLDEDSDEEEEVEEEAADDVSVGSDLGWPEGDDDDDDDGDSKMPASLSNETNVVRDNKFALRLVCHLTNSTPGDKSSFVSVTLPRALHYLNHDRKGKRLGSKAICARFKTFVDAGLIRGETLRLFVEAYRSSKLNKGHRKVDGRETHHSPSSEQIKCTDDLDQQRRFQVRSGRHARPGDHLRPDCSCAWEEGDGSTGKEHHTRRQALPEGQVPAGDRPPGTHPEVQEGKEEGAKTKKAKAKKFLEYELEVDKKVCNANSSNGSVYTGGDNNLFVARVRIVKKKTKKKKTKR